MMMMMIMMTREGLFIRILRLHKSHRGQVRKNPMLSSTLDSPSSFFSISHSQAGLAKFLVTSVKAFELRLYDSLSFAGQFQVITFYNQRQESKLTILNCEQRILVG